MANQLKETLKRNLQPYLFALKEGKKIQNDFLDYSLLLIHVQNNEIIKSPDRYDLTPFFPVPASVPEPERRNHPGY